MNHQYFSNMQHYLNASDSKEPIRREQKEASSSQLTLLHSLLQLLRIKHYIQELTKSTHDIH